MLGRHAGIINFTVGQRRGLNLGGAAEPYYVVRLDAVERRVVVGPREALGRSIVRVRELNWLGPTPLSPEGLRVSVKLRSAHRPAGAMVVLAQAGDAELRLDEPQFGVAPGQAAVFYDGTRLLGGGWIDSTDERLAAA